MKRNNKANMFTNAEMEIIYIEIMKIAKDNHIIRNADLLKLIPYNTKILTIAEGKVNSSKINVGWWIADYITKLVYDIRNDIVNSYDLDLKTIQFIKNLEYRELQPRLNPSNPRVFNILDIYNKFTDVTYNLADTRYVALYRWFINREDVIGTAYKDVTYSTLYRALVKYRYKETSTKMPNSAIVRTYLMEKYNAINRVDDDGYKILYYVELRHDIPNIKEVYRLIPKDGSLDRLKFKIMSQSEYIIKAPESIKALVDFHSDRDYMHLIAAYKECADEFNGYATPIQIATVITRNYSRIMNVRYSSTLRRSFVSRVKNRGFVKELEELHVS